MPFTRSGGVIYGGGGASKVWWDDGPLKMAARNAFKAAGIEDKTIAQAKSKSSRVAKSMSVRFFSGGAATGLNIAGIIRANHPLAHIQEGGAKAHYIAPKGSRAVSSVTGGIIGAAKRQIGTTRTGKRKGKQALKFPDGGFARGAVSHPGRRADPALGPAAMLFPALFRKHLRKRL